MKTKRAVYAHGGMRRVPAQKKGKKHHRKEKNIDVSTITLKKPAKSAGKNNKKTTSGMWFC